MCGNAQVSTNSDHSPTNAGFKRVLSLWDLVLFGLAFVGPTAPYSMFAIATVKSQGHLPLVYLLAMVVMSLTAISYLLILTRGFRRNLVSIRFE